MPIWVAIVPFIVGVIIVGRYAFAWGRGAALEGQVHVHGEPSAQ
jgi:hypothetical protein